MAVKNQTLVPKIEKHAALQLSSDDINLLLTQLFISTHCGIGQYDWMVTFLIFFFSSPKQHEMTQKYILFDFEDIGFYNN